MAWMLLVLQLAALALSTPYSGPRIPSEFCHPLQLLCAPTAASRFLLPSAGSLQLPHPAVAARGPSTKTFVSICVGAFQWYSPDQINKELFDDTWAAAG